MSEYLFVYGTLRPGLAPAPLKPLVDRCRALGRGSTPGKLYDLGPYPGAVFDEEAATLVWGEVCELPDDPRALPALDEYEGYRADDPSSSLYLRLKRSVTLADRRTLDCWAYAYNRNVGSAPIVTGGDYAKWRSARAVSVD